MRRKIKKLIRSFKRGDYNKKVVIISLAVALCLAIVIYKGFIAKAYPGSWDSYTGNGGIFNTIYNYEKSTMDTYESATNYTLVHDINNVNDKYTDTSGLQYYYGHGSSYQYTNTTIDSTNKWISRWYVSPFGPLIDYIQKNCKQNDGTAESTSIQFASEGNLYKNSDHIYISQDTKDYADSKSLASFAYSSSISASAIPPLLINSNSSTLDSGITNAARSNSIKNLVVLGGGEIYDTLFGIGEDFNVVRIGGIERNDTFNLLAQTEKNKSEIYNVTSKPTVDSNGVVCDIKTDKITYTDKLKIKSYLDSYDFKDAADLVLKNISYGDPTNVQSGSYQVLIGCKDSADSTKSRFLKVYFVKYINSVTYGVYQYIGQDYFTSSTTTPTTGNITATLNAPTKVFCGDDVNMDGNGKDTAKDVTKMSGFIWVNDKERTGVNGVNPSTTATVTGTTENPNVSSISFDNHSSPVWFSETGIYHANSTVTDSSSNSAKSDIKSITAVTPVPKVIIDKTGTEKQNRKLTLDASRSNGGCSTENGNKRWTIDWSKAKWEIKALGSTSMSDLRIQTHTTGSTDGTVLYDPSQGITDLSKLDGLKTFDILSKNPGQYEFKLTLTNDCSFNSNWHYTSSKNITVTILEDAVPIANFWAPGSEYRDPNDKNSEGFAQAPLIGIDDGSEQNGSYSTDGDYIAKRLWIISFDEENNHIYSDDEWYYYDPSSKTLEYLGTYSQAKNADINSYDCGNETNISPKVTHVGTWPIELIVEEEFGQDYIPQFVTQSDRRVGIKFDE